jgi:hypothetical protein
MDKIQEGTVPVPHTARSLRAMTILPFTLYRISDQSIVRRKTFFLLK